MMAGRDLEALVLCGGRGERLLAAEPQLPKPLVEVGGRPFLAWVVESLLAGGCARIVLCAGFRAEAIEAWAQTCGRGNLVVSREPDPLGTGGALKHAERLLTGERLVVANGDSHCLVDLAAMARQHETCRARGTIAVTAMEDPRDYGTVRSDSGGAVVAFEEKAVAAGGGWVNAGLYLLERSVLAEIAPDTVCSLEREVFPSLVGRGLYSFPADGPVYDIGTPERLRLARETLARRTSRR